MNEKKKVTHDLAAFKSAFLNHRAITKTAARSALALGYSVSDVVEIIEHLQRKHFFQVDDEFF